MPMPVYTSLKPIAGLLSVYQNVSQTIIKQLVPHTLSYQVKTQKHHQWKRFIESDYFIEYARLGKVHNLLS